MTAAAPPMLPASARVSSTRRETPDTVTVTLTTASGGTGFLPGQFNMLYAFGIGEVPVSASGDPARSEDVVHTVKSVGAVTAALCALQPGDIIGLRGPFGRPWPMEDIVGTDVVLIAGGLGFAPLRPVVHHILHERQRYGRVSLLVGARTPADLLFQQDLQDWKTRGELQVHTIVDRAGPDWKARVGVVPSLLDDISIDARRTAALVCGPELMMRFTIRDLLRRTLSARQIHVSLERNMKCAVGFCGHCQFGPAFVCKDGPVFRFDAIQSWFWPREV